MDKLLKQCFTYILILVTLLAVCKPAYPQNDRYNFPDTLNKKRLTGLLITGATVYAASMTGLYFLWYKDYPQSSFHFYNDMNGWLQIDKIGHTTTSYNVGRLGYLAFRWTGVKEKTAIWLGGSSGFLFTLSFEILDGLSEGWGFSVGDIAANATGSAFFISQQLIWKEQRMMLKYSFHTTEYAQYNPEGLGRNFIQQSIKDYNGQTYWLSVNIKSFAFRQSRLPKWLSIAFGYGAKGMIGAGGNPSNIDGKPVPHYDRTRQYFFAPEIDLSRIQTGSEFWNAVLDIVGFIKFPLPTLEYNKEDNFKFHWIYF